MPFTKTEVDIHDDYTVEAVDPAWLAQGVKSPKHLMLDPDNCILCRACEDVCPWNCICMMSTGHRARTPTRRRWRPRCSGRHAPSSSSTTTPARGAPSAWTGAPRDTLYYARLPEGSGGKRTHGRGSASQAEAGVSEATKERDAG